MLNSLITSKTRVKLLLKFFLNPETRAYLRGLSEEFGESTNAVRIELNRLSEAGLLDSKSEGRKKIYSANIKNPLFSEVHNMVRKFLGIDKVQDIVNNLGDIDLAFITGDYAKGKDSGLIDLVIVGSLNKEYLDILISQTEENIKRKIRVLVLSAEEYEKLSEKLNIKQALILWSKK